MNENYNLRNKSISFESLRNAVILLFTDSQEEFIRAYNLATHDTNGASIWYYVKKEERQKLQANPHVSARQLRSFAKRKKGK